jgi:hypothetical protein
MKTFHCTHCRNLVFFENVSCLHCGHSLAYLPDRDLMAALTEVGEGMWRIEGPDRNRQTYRLCANYSSQNICNWAVPLGDEDSLCPSCRLTRVIPDLTPSGRLAWGRLESAKRRLVQSLLSLQLPVAPKGKLHPDGVIFEFLKDSSHTNGDAQRVLTGHDNGLITINVAEADDVQREAQRQRQHEPYRTLLGHFRHEIGHYYWDLLIRHSDRLDDFRQLFGDERADYAAALKRHYRKGPPANWADNYISSYGASHPWEDWAESWAHFLHMIDALETSGAAGLSLQPQRAGEPVLRASPASQPIMRVPFNRMIERWLPLTYVMNNLSRGLGLADSYPFVLTPRVIEKLRFIYETVKAARVTPRASYSLIATRALRTAGLTALAVGATLSIVALVDQARRHTATLGDVE